MKCFPLNKWWAYQLSSLDPRINPRAAQVFGRLIEHHNTKTGLCCPSEGTLAQALDCNERTIRTAISTLREFGYVHVSPGLGIGGANLYVLSIPSGKKVFEAEAKKRQVWRKELAAKPKKKPKNEPVKGKSATLKPPNPFASKSIASPSKAKKRERLEAELIRRLGGGERAWEKLLAIEENVFEGIVSKCVTGMISFEKAVENLLHHVDWGGKQS